MVRCRWFSDSWLSNMYSATQYSHTCAAEALRVTHGPDLASNLLSVLLQDVHQTTTGGTINFQGILCYLFTDVGGTADAHQRMARLTDCITGTRCCVSMSRGHCITKNWRKPL